MVLMQLQICSVFACTHSEQYGIQTTLDQTFQAPGLIKHVLANKAKIDRCASVKDGRSGFDSK